MNSFLRSMNPHPKIFTLTYNTQNLNRQPPDKFGNLVDPHLKTTSRILARFQNFRNSWKEIYDVLWIATEILMNKWKTKIQKDYKWNMLQKRCHLPTRKKNTLQEKYPHHLHQLPAHFVEVPNTPPHRVNEVILSIMAQRWTWGSHEADKSAVFHMYVYCKSYYIHVFLCTYFLSFCLWPSLCATS